MNWLSRWSPLRVFIFILIKCGTTRPIVLVPLAETPFPRLIVAASHTALSGDLGLLIIELPSAYRTTTSGTTIITATEDVNIDLEEDDEDYSIENEQIPFQDPFVLRVLRLDGFTSELIGEVPVVVPNTTGVNVSLVIPCGFFSRGGTYSLQLQQKSLSVPNRFTDTASFHDEQMHTTLDVRWPTPSLALEPQHFDTYPSQPVLATLEYTGISCTPSVGVPVPTYTVQLIYCGTSVLSCDPRNRSHIQMLYTEELKGFPEQRIITLRCEFFGLAGHYALRLKPSDANPSAPTTSAYIKVEWSDLFVFNVHARSIYPCDGGDSVGDGVSVLFEYPACRLAGDKVRVYGRLHADVDSLAPPSSLHYVAELKAPTGVHTLTFNCDLFTEHYVEYCFVYISQAYNGAMSEVRVDCIPTFPLQEGDAGGWSQWSQWTPCSSSCVGGTHTRHRFCDSPPPRYGAKFCQGDRVETEVCGGTAQLDLRGTWSLGDWECRHGEGLAADRPEVAAEVGNKCRCGCSLYIDIEERRKMLAASSSICPGRSFWLIRTKPSHVVNLHLDQARFSCQDQYVRIRDGDSLIDELLADIGISKKKPAMHHVVSTGPRMLFEFFSEEKTVDPETKEVCLAGFLAHITIARKLSTENGTTLLPSVYQNPKVMAAGSRWSLWLTPAHLAAASLLFLMFLFSVFLALQYVFKYRKYQVAEDLDSLTDNSACSGSIQGIARRSRAMSSSTLISEVVSLVRLPRRSSMRHARLDETSADIEEGYESTDTQPDRENEAEEVKEKECITHRSWKEENGSQRTTVACGSVHNIPTRRSSALSTSKKMPSSTAVSATAQEIKYARPVKLRTFEPVSPVSEEAASMSEDGRYFSATSTSTSLNNVRVVPHSKRTINLLRIKGFSQASSSSNSTLRCYSGKESKDRRNRERLLQGQGSEFSLANPDLDLELDYYDYNVVNAGAAPGSYLGMDPAFLVWIPPLTEHETDPTPQQKMVPQYAKISECSEYLNTEGAALTPVQYKKVRESHQENSSENDSDDVIKLKKFDPGECRLHDEIIMEYKAKLDEGMLPIHRILNDSKVKISNDSWSSISDVIPNRLESKGTALGRERLLKKTRNFNCKIQNKHMKTTLSSESSTQSLDIEETDLKLSMTLVNDLDLPSTKKQSQDPDKDYCEINISSKTSTPRTYSILRVHSDIDVLTAIYQDDKKVSENVINIPLAEFSRNRPESPVKIHGKAVVKMRNANFHSSNYGVPVQETKESLYDIIAKDDDDIKFVDDDDEYIDNKVVA